MESHLGFDQTALRVAMARAGFRSLSSLARCVELSESYVRAIAHGLVPSGAVQARLAGALGVTVGELWRSIRAGS